MKFGFTNEYLDVRTKDGLNDELLTPLLYASKSDDLFRVPIGSTTDGLSVPRAVQNVIPAVGDEAWWAGVLHDAAYRKTLEKWDSSSQDWILANLSQFESDSLILEAMESQGVGLIKRHTIYRALRMFGSFAYNADRKDLSKSPRV